MTERVTSHVHTLPHGPFSVETHGFSLSPRRRQLYFDVKPKRLGHLVTPPRVQKLANLCRLLPSRALAGRYLPMSSIFRLKTRTSVVFCMAMSEAKTTVAKFASNEFEFLFIFAARQRTLLRCALLGGGTQVQHMQPAPACNMRVDLGVGRFVQRDSNQLAANGTIRGLVARCNVHAAFVVLLLSVLDAENAGTVLTLER